MQEVCCAAQIESVQSNIIQNKSGEIDGPARGRKVPAVSIGPIDGDLGFVGDRHWKTCAVIGSGSLKCSTAGRERFAVGNFYCTPVVDPKCSTIHCKTV